MVILGHLELAKYPFLADAGQYLKECGFTLEQLGGDPDLQAVREKAFHRIQMAAEEGRVYRSDIAGGQAAEFALPREVFSFLLAIVLLKLSGAHHLIRKFALQEARGAEYFLEKDLGRAVTDAQIRLAAKIIWDLAEVNVSKQDEHFVITIEDYLRRAVQFHAKEWKLINRRVESGMVFLTPHETVRLIRQELVAYIHSKISAAAAPPMVSGLQEFVDRLVAMNSRFQPKTTTSGELPPCIKHAIKTLGDGENLSHSGRFMLATFMLARGHAVEEIVPYFQNAPDYNESITRYQIKHLSGESGSSTRYRCQSCEKLRTLDLCYIIPECAGINNPTQFGAG